MDIGLLLSAGAETTTTVIRNIFMHTVATPTVYNKLKDELRTAIRGNRISSPVTIAEAKQLPYLQAVIYEGFRLLPPGIIGFPKRVPPEGDVICGRFVPGGTDVFINWIDFMRDKDVFGEDADIFRPERFLDCDEQCKSVREKQMDLIFGTGRWMCPGKFLAHMEINKLVVELFRRFDFQMANPAQPWKIKGYITWMISDFYVRVTEGSLG
jgi:cytochrome P450